MLPEAVERSWNLIYVLRLSCRSESPSKARSVGRGRDLSKLKRPQRLAEDFNKAMESKEKVKQPPQSERFEGNTQLQLIALLIVQGTCGLIQPLYHYPFELPFATVLGDSL